jgi:hypothetical protein
MSSLLLLVISISISIIMILMIEAYSGIAEGSPQKRHSSDMIRLVLVFVGHGGIVMPIVMEPSQFESLS